MKAERREVVCQKRYGMSAEMAAAMGDLLRTKHGSPYHRFMQQKWNARRQGIAWQLSFAEWWQIWQESGHYEKRGRGQGYCMSRMLDAGAIAVGNVYITTCAQNVSDQYLVRLPNYCKDGTPRRAKAAA